MTTISDTEKVKYCATAMEIQVYFNQLDQQYHIPSGVIALSTDEVYDPLQNKIQAFEILERFQFDISSPRSPEGLGVWGVLHEISDTEEIIGTSSDLRRAIVDCAVELYLTKLRDLNG